MIARKPHPQEPYNPNRCVFVPLMYDGNRGEWIPLMGPEGYRYDEVDAARECVVDFRRRWRTIEQIARRLRAFTEHPAFATFAADGIDAAMIAEAACASPTCRRPASGSSASCSPKPPTGAMETDS